MGKKLIRRHAAALANLARFIFASQRGDEVKASKARVALEHLGVRLDPASFDVRRREVR